MAAVIFFHHHLLLGRSGLKIASAFPFVAEDLAHLPGFFDRESLYKDQIAKKKGAVLDARPLFFNRLPKMPLFISIKMHGQSRNL